MKPRLVPELDVSDHAESIAFYQEVCGFRVVNERPDERFVYLTLEGADLMLEEASGPGRRFLLAPLEQPYGRGMNLQIEVSDVNALHERAQAADARILVPLEERWYRIGDEEAGNRQVVVVDTDGYLLRFFSDLGRRPKLGTI